MIAMVSMEWYSVTWACNLRQSTEQL